MRRILITGKNGYIARRFEEYIRRFPEEYRVRSISLRDGAWRETDFSQYDVVLHTAGIAHVRETPENAELYYAVNRGLAIETAERAKSGGVEQFIFLSSMSVYGVEEGTITAETVPAPVSHYGKSKLQAEEGLLPLESETFTVSILRPPMVYGDGCKGNYQTLVRIARSSPVFPDYQNRRSMVSIETLCRFIKDVIDGRSGGVFVPQERAYICTSEMVREIAARNGRRMKLVRWLNPAAALARRFTRRGRKAFGDLIYQDS